MAVLQKVLASNVTLGTVPNATLDYAPGREYPPPPDIGHARGSCRPG